MVKVPQDLDNASTEELKELVQTLLQEVAALQREVAGLQEENARLKGKPPRPDIKPSGMAENADRLPDARELKQKLEPPRRELPEDIPVNLTGLASFDDLLEGRA